MRVTKPLYALYNRRIQNQLKAGPMPRHVGVILDGNRRFARAMGFDDVAEGHRAGAKKIDELLEWCADLGIPVITLWLLSNDNLRRNPSEISSLIAIIEAKVVELTYAPLTYQRRYRIRVLGRLEQLPASTRTAIREAEERTRDHDGPTMNLAIGYGGREEILDAVARLIRHRLSFDDSIDSVISALTPEEVSHHLYTADLPDPDLIIRTSGEVRLSGFLLWQSAYSEFYFCDVHWPAFRRVDFLRALRNYQHRHRRFGGDNAQAAESAEPVLQPMLPLDASWAITPRLYNSAFVVRTTEAPDFIDIRSAAKNRADPLADSAPDPPLL